MDKRLKEVCFKVYEEDPYCDELFGETGNITLVGNITPIIRQEDWDFTCRQIFWTLLAKDFLAEDDWDYEEVIFEKDTDEDSLYEGQILIKARKNDGTIGTMFYLREKEE